MRPDWFHTTQAARPVTNHIGTNNTNVESNKRINQVNQNRPSETFGQILQNKMASGQTQHLLSSKDALLQFSKHAQDRLRLRDIHLSPDQLSRIQKGVEDVAQKGGKDSLVICGDLSFVVNVPNRMVVTALDSSQSASQVFTQIDSAVIV